MGRTVPPRKSSMKPAYAMAPANIVERMVMTNNSTCSHTRSRNFAMGCQTMTGVGSKLADVLEVFTWLEADRASRRDAHFLACPRVTADAALARLDLEHTESAQLDALAPLLGSPHRVENRVDCHLGFDLGDVRDFRDFVD